MIKFFFFVFYFSAISLPSFGETFGLLIGIGNYGNQGWNLQGPPNDVALIRDYLEKTYPGIDLRILLDRNATHSRILEELARLADARADDTVYIYFSGHGSQTPDLNGDEITNSFDETWVSFGTRIDTQALDDFDVLDDEIFYYLSKIPTERIVFISDSCHAGSVGHDQDERTLSRDLREHPEGRKFEPAESLRGIRLSAVKDDQLAVDTPIPQPDGSVRVHGLFTWCLVSVLKETGLDGQWNDVLVRTRALMRSFPRGRVLEPQLEGDGSLRLDLSESGAMEGAAAIRGKQGGLWVLEAGLVSGVPEGSSFICREKGIHLQVVEAGLFLSRAERVSGAEPDIGDLFHLQEIGAKGAKIKVSVAAAHSEDEEVSAFVQRTVRAAFSHQISWEPQRDRADWVLWVVRSTGYEPNPFQLPQSSLEEPRTLWLADSLGRPLLSKPMMRADNDKARLVSRIRQLLRWSSLLNLNNPYQMPDFQFLPAFYLRGKASVSGQEQLLINGREYHGFSPGEDDALPKGCVMVPSLKNLSAQPRYLYILNFAPDGNISVVFPRRSQRGEIAKFEAETVRSLTGVKLLLGESGWERFRVISAAKELNRNMFHLSQEEEGSREASGAVFDGGADKWSTALFEYKILPAD